MSYPSHDFLQIILDASLAFQRKQDSPDADIAAIICKIEKVLQVQHPTHEYLLVDAAVRAGKLWDCQRVWALEYCRRDQEAFKAFVNRAPVSRAACPLEERVSKLERRYEALP